jgi:hypothetical protein
MRRIFLWISAIAASLITIGVVLQVYFVASWIFGAGDAIDVHRANGYVIWALGPVVGISGLIAYWGSWRNVAVSIALPILSEVQIFFVGNLDDPSDNVSGWIEGLHGGLALFVFLLAGGIAYRDLRALDVPRLLGLSQGGEAAPDDLGRTVPE